MVITYYVMCDVSQVFVLHGAKLLGRDYSLAMRPEKVGLSWELLLSYLTSYDIDGSRSYT